MRFPESDAAALVRFEGREEIPIVLAAILPIVLAPETGGTIAVLIGVASWIVFLADFVVSERRLTRYTSTWVGRFDLSVVVFTAPWFLLPGFEAGRFIIVLRLARLARVVMASKGARRLLERLGKVGLIALGVMVSCDWVAYHAEHATNSDFATFGDALWWGHRHADHCRLRRHRPEDSGRSVGGRRDHADGRRGARRARRIAGELLPRRLLER